MQTYKQFDVVVVPFPFTDSNKTKRRPALVLSDRNFLTIDKSILAMITTNNHPAWSLDTAIEDLEVTGLNASSIIRFKLFTLDNSLIIKKIGSLSKRDRTLVTTKMRKVFNI
jgi:mRNA interferase MazF